MPELDKKAGVIRRVAVVNCGYCGKSEPLKNDTGRYMTETAAAHCMGWRYTEEYGWVCPEDVKRLIP